MKFLIYIKNLILPMAAFSAFALPAAAQNVKFGNEAADTTRITEILKQEALQERPGNVSRIARNFINTPYGAGTLEGDSIETLTVRLDSMDCTTFVETVLALAGTAREDRQSWRDFVYNLRHLRYRNGEENGYGSRLHYVSDWIVDNSARGNIVEVTADAPSGVRYKVKTLDFMSRNRDRYRALADESNLDAIRRTEAGYSNHRYPYIKASAVKDKSITQIARDGDVVIFTTAINGLDATHMGIIVMEGGKPRLLHASSRGGKVMIDPLSLPEYVAHNRPEGIRIVRLRSR